MSIEFAEQKHVDSTPAILGRPKGANLQAPESVRIVGNRYLLVDKTGVGPLGDVYQAIDQQLSKALKYEQRVNIELFTLSDRQIQFGNRFASRFAELSSIAHPNISKAIDFGIDGKMAFLTRELLEGVSLRSVISETSSEPFSENEIQAVLGGVAKALSYIHGKGLAHTNLKPDSILVTSSYEVKIVDFASVALKQLIDSSAEGRTDISQTLRAIDDVYRLAAIAYEMLTNERAYGSVSRTNARRIEQTLQETRGMSRQRKKALLNALATQRDERTPTVKNFAKDFGVSGNETLRPDKRRKKPRSRPTRERSSGPLAAVLVLVAAAGLVWQNFDVLDAKLSGWREQFAPRAVSNPVASEVETAPIPDSDPIVASTPVVEDTVVPAPVAESDTSDPDEILLQEENSSDPGEAQAIIEPTTESVVDDTFALPDTNVADTNNFAEIDSVSTPASEPAQQIAGQTAASLSQLTGVRYPVNVESVVTQTQSPSGLVTNVDPTEIVFDQKSTMVNESQSMASISIQRRGNLDKDASVIWWTGDNTANADLDYAELGAKIETINAGQESITVYVPIVSDSAKEDRESFYVFANLDAASKSDANMHEVFIVDDDG